MQGYNPNWAGALSAGAQQANTMSRFGQQVGEGINNLLSDREDQRNQELQAQKAQELGDIAKTGDYNAVSDYLIANPDVSVQTQKNMLGAMGIKDEQQKNQLMGDTFKLLSNPKNGQSVFEDRIASIDARGGDSSHTRAELAAYTQDPEGYINQTKGFASTTFPTQYKEFSTAMGEGKPVPMTDYQTQSLKLRQDELEQRDRLARDRQTQVQQQKEKLAQEKQNVVKTKVEEAKTKKFDSLSSGLSGTIDTLNLVNAIDTHPGTYKAVGVQHMFPTLPGSDAAGAESLIETLGSQNFLNAIQNMKGMGALSDAEGKKLSSAVAALNLNQSDKDFKKQLGVIKGLTSRAKAKYEKDIKKLGFDVPSYENVYESKSDGPEVGTVDGGYEFIGGNPANRNSWRLK